MAFVPGYEHDIFISYSHTDNDPIIGGKPGWVDFFEELLRKRLRVRLREGGSEVKIFRDVQFRHYGKFSKQLADELSKSATFICVLSPGYIGSDWCWVELSEFFKRTGSDRIIKVVKSVFDPPTSNPKLKSLLAEIEEVLHYNFYRKDEASGLFTDLQPEIIADHIPDALGMIDEIVQNLVELLKKLRSTAMQAPSDSQPARAPLVAEAADAAQFTVYLAETTNEKDLLEKRNEVRNELLQFDCRVLPDQPLPQDADELICLARGHIEQASLSVHLLGANYGVRPESEDRSIPHIQYELAAQTSSEGRLTQLVWMPNGVLPKDENQRIFIEDVKNKTPEFLQTTIEDLKTEIHKKLKPDPSSGWDNADDANPINVSLFFHDQDIQDVKPLYSYLTFNEMFQVRLPLKDAHSFENHKQLLQGSDAVLLYYGSADQDWFATIWRQIQRHLSASRTKPVLAKAIYAGQPLTNEKDLLESQELTIIKNYGQFTPISLAPFLEKIRGAKGGVL